MKIHTLELTNFGIIDHQKFFFDDGLYVFSGNNGEGKSTVLKAISLLLFNKVPGKLSDYIQWGKSECEVSCSFEHKGNLFQTSTKITEKGSTRWLYNEIDKEELNVTSAVTEKLNEILDTKRAIASTTSFEHEIDLIATSPSERREYLKKVYDLSFKEEKERIESDIERAKTISVQTKTEIDSLQSQEFDLYSLQRPPMSKEKYDELKEEIENKKAKIKKYESSLDSLSKELKNIQEWKEEYESLKNELQDIQKEIFQTESKIKTQETLIEEYESFDFSSIEEEYNAKSKELSESIEICKTDIRNAETAIEERIPRQLQALKYNDKEHEDLKGTFLKVTYDVEALEKKKNNLKDGICPVCGSSFESHDLDTFKNELQELLQQKSNLEVQISSLNEKKLETDKLKKALESYSSELSSLNPKLENLELQLLHLRETKNEKIKNKKEDIKKSIESVNDIIEILRQDIKSKNDSTAKYEEKISKIANKIEQSKGVEHQIEIFERQLTDLDLILSDLMERKDVYDSIISDNENKRKINEDIERKKEERDKKVLELQKSYEENQQNFETYSQALKLLTKDFPSFVISKLINNLQSYTNEFLQQVYPKYSLAFKESKSSLAVTYNEGVDVKLASGFEKQVFSFAYKYALGKIQNYNILFLDEVDSAASEENSRLFYETLAKMKSFFTQIFIITHKQDTKDLLVNDFDASVYTLKGGVVG